ncbi:AAA-domain-containing protein [Viridothelium virens]|uniref:AAA-domain-containing protein n=1 Tax=Viridothelium virens TaxID=1048519 RepID=A0A6A6GY01_VIRVR|nr:AAA-domain-containing protein [Viridothelium virens]
MSSRTKRRLEEFDPNKSDSDDLDYGATSPAPRSRKSKKSSGTKKRKPAKRPRRAYDSDEEDDIEDDSDEISEDSSAEDTPEEEAELNPRTGRRIRGAVKKNIKYEESSEEEIEETGNSDNDSDEAGPTSRRPKRQSLVVKLKVSPAYLHRLSPQPSSRPTRSRGRSGATPPASDMAVKTRRSSRLSNDNAEPPIELTDSGKHAQPARSRTTTPEAPPRRPSRATKGLKKPPSTIIEASQEQSGTTKQDDDEILMENEGGDGEGVGEVLPSEKSQHTSEEENVEDEPVEEDVAMAETEVQDSIHGDEDDDEPVRTGRNLRSRRDQSNRPSTQNSQRKRKGVDESSDFEPGAEGEGEEDMSASDDAQGSPKKKARQQDTDTDSGGGGRRSRRLASQKRDSQRSGSELDQDELAEEAEELAELNHATRRKRRKIQQIMYDDQPKLRNRSNKPDYRILRPELAFPIEEDDGAPVLTQTPSRNRRGGGGGAYRSLFSTQGPFGGAGGPPPVFGGPEGTGAAGGADSDSSDDEMNPRPPQGIGGTVGMTPTTTGPKGLFPQAHNADPAQGPTGATSAFGKVKDKKALADADPLGVDQNVNFDGVGGLENHINQLKEMVALPLLYPEVFMRYHITPPRGVLFHGPPGTGKTLLARALASSVSSQGKKVTFYMRKGADALSKWVGEAERQLRLLFEEARKNQPSIIFFDEIDGLAPVRSSKQEQIHASIVATLLALMDGMDGRGQVIVIGATNRPDTVDPALRRPGRFDREFYFPLPDQKSRRSIIDIHTKGWDPPLKPEFKDQLAELTKGYGGADLRALCTEAALNAVQGTFPQIYKSNEKLIIDPSKIKVLAKDFMISVNRMIPSSERSTTSAASPLAADIEPLLRTPLDQIVRLLDDIIPQKKKATALEEAQFDDRDDDGFERETMQRNFERSRIFRPRLLIRGVQGMGQQYLGSALLNKFESLHVQSFDLPTLLEDSSRAPEAAIVQLFKEVRRHKPSVIYIPNVDVWYETVSSAVIKTFTSLLRSLPPNDPVLLLGVLESSSAEIQPDSEMLRDLFGFSSKNQFVLNPPNQSARNEYFGGVVGYISRSPLDFPDPSNRKPRQLEQLEVAPAPKEPGGPSKDQLKAQKKQDRHTLNMLKLQIQPVMDQIRNKYKKFRAPVIEESHIAYLYDEQDPEKLSTNLPHEQLQQQEVYRPFELSTDDKNVPGLKETATGKFYYNLEIVTIEKRLSNGYYKRPKDFLGDIKRLAKDARTFGDPDRLLKANEMLANVEVDMQYVEASNPGLVAECNNVYNRELEREKMVQDKAKGAAKDVPFVRPNVPPYTSKTTEQTSGPVTLGEPIPGQHPLPPFTPKRLGELGSNLSNGFTSGTHLQTNGTSHLDEDSHMTDSQDVGSNPQEAAGFITPSQGNTQTQRSQQSALTRMAPGSQAQDYQNSASTTTSGQKTSDRDRSSGSGPYQNSQSTNGIHRGDHPDFSMVQPLQGSSQLPDTQGSLSPKLWSSFSSNADNSSGAEMPEYSNSSQSQPHSSQTSQPQQSQAQQPPVVPAFPRNNSINALLNDPRPASGPSGSAPLGPPSQPQHPPLQLNRAYLAELHEELANRSSGLSVEQLEQVNAAIMDAIWKHKMDWNRNNVAVAVQEKFNETIKDIEEVQGIADPSQDKLLRRVGMGGMGRVRDEGVGIRG